MNVSIITMRFPARSEVFAANNIRMFREYGCDVEVFCLRSTVANAHKLSEEFGLGNLKISQGTISRTIFGILYGIMHPIITLNLLCFILKNAGNIVHLAKTLMLSPAALSIFCLLQKKKPDVVHLYWGHYPSIIGALVLKFMPNTVLSSSLGAYDLTTKYPGSAQVAKKCSFVRAMAAGDLPRLHELGIDEKNLSVIYNGVDLDFCRENSQENKVALRVVSVGRLVKEKAFDDALLVFAKLKQVLPESTFVIIGDGPEREKLEKLTMDHNISDSVFFRGALKHEQVLREVAKARLFLFMSAKSSERLPNVVKEAMVAKTPCVATKTPCMEELLPDKKCGYLVVCHDIDNAFEYSRTILEREDSMKILVEAAYRHVAENFDLKKTGAKFVQCWKNALEVKKAGTIKK